MTWATLDPASISPAWALLGRALEVRTVSRGSLKFSRCWLAADPRGGALLIGPDNLVKHSNAKAPADAIRLRERFTGDPSDGRSWSLPTLPTSWEDLGPAVSILYESDKVNGGGTGRPELFRHEFSPGATAYRVGGFLAIVGKRIRVDAAGVRN